MSDSAGVASPSEELSCTLLHHASWSVSKAKGKFQEEKVSSSGEGLEEVDGFLALQRSLPSCFPEVKCLQELIPCWAPPHVADSPRKTMKRPGHLLGILTAAS